jgi:hypothetical protein
MPPEEALMLQEKIWRGKLRRVLPHKSLMEIFRVLIFFYLASQRPRRV